MADLTAEDAARETAALWCIRLSENDMSTAEWSEFDGWLAQPGNADLLQQAASIWEATGEVGNWPNMIALRAQALNDVAKATRRRRSEEHTSELQSLMRISYAVFCLKKKKRRIHILTLNTTCVKVHIRVSRIESIME